MQYDTKKGQDIKSPDLIVLLVGTDRFELSTSTVSG